MGDIRQLAHAGVAWCCRLAADALARRTGGACEQAPALRCRQRRHSHRLTAALPLCDVHGRPVLLQATAMQASHQTLQAARRMQRSRREEQRGQPLHTTGHGGAPRLRPAPQQAHKTALQQAHKTATPNQSTCTGLQHLQLAGSRPCPCACRHITISVPPGWDAQTEHAKFLVQAAPPPAQAPADTSQSRRRPAWRRQTRGPQTRWAPAGKRVGHCHIPHHRSTQCRQFGMPLEDGRLRAREMEVRN